MLLSLLTVVSIQAKEIASFEPVFAADQKVLTLASMQHEVDQFKAHAKWVAQQELLKSALAREELMGKEYERAKDLFRRGLSSQSALDRARLDFERAESSVANLRDTVQKLATEAKVWGLRVREEGNPGSDLRNEAVQNILESLNSEKRFLEKTLAMAEGDEAFYQNRYENGRRLRDNGTITDLELERRKLDWEGAKNRVGEIRAQLHSNALALTGAEKSKERLPSNQ